MNSLIGLKTKKILIFIDDVFWKSLFIYYALIANINLIKLISTLFRSLIIFNRYKVITYKILD